MNLDRRGVEFVRFPVSGVPNDADPIEITFDGDDWVETTYNAGRTVVTLLVAGPDADDPPNAATILPVGRNWFWTRLLDNPEVIIRKAPGYIDVA